MKQLYCSHPRSVFNTALVREVIIRGSLVAVRTSGFSEVFSLPVVRHYENSEQMRKRVTDILRKYVYCHDVQYFYDADSGEFFDARILVPCGHCSLCQAKKQRSLAARCKMECQQHDRLPFFITLTYDDEHLPKDGELCYRDVQLFYKRFRQFLVRVYQFTSPIRYFCAGEYGLKNDRPHYHLLLFGLSFDNIFKIDEMIRNSWKNGLTQTKRCFDSDGAYYVAKYSTKSDSNKHRVHEFHRCSINLGVDFFIRSASKLVDFPTETDLQYLDKFDGKCKPLPLTKYFINKLFPHNIPTKVFDSLRDYKVIDTIMLGGDLSDIYSSYYKEHLHESLPPFVDVDFACSFNDFNSVDWSIFNDLDMAFYIMSCEVHYKYNLALPNRIKYDQFYRSFIESLPDVDLIQESIKIEQSNIKTKIASVL